MIVNLNISANLSWPAARFSKTFEFTIFGHHCTFIFSVVMGQVVGHGSFIRYSLVSVFRELRPDVRGNNHYHLHRRLAANRHSFNNNLNRRQRLRLIHQH